MLAFLFPHLMVFTYFQDTLVDYCDKRASNITFTRHLTLFMIKKYLQDTYLLYYVEMKVLHVANLT